MKTRTNRDAVQVSLRFQRGGRSYDRSELVTYHTADPSVPAIFHSLRDGTVFMKVPDGVRVVEDRHVPEIAQRYCLPELLRQTRVAC